MTGIYSVDVIKLTGYNVIYNEGQINNNDGLLVYIRSGLEYSYNVIEGVRLLEACTWLERGVIIVFIAAINVFLQQLYARIYYTNVSFK